MRNILFILFLGLLAGIPEQSFAKLSAPSPLPVSSLGERSARLEWNWTPGGGTITDFEVDVARKGGVADCRDIESWGVPNLLGAGERSFNVRGLERGEVYCWKITARADDSNQNSEFSYGVQFATQVGARGGVCGNSRCEAGEDPVSCPQDCSANGGTPSGPPAEIKNPIGSQSLPQLLENALNFLFGLAIVMLPIVIIYGGILLLGSGGDPAKVSQGKTILLWAVVAFTIILLARGLPPILRGLL